MTNRNNRQVKSQVTKKAVQRQSANHPENSPGKNQPGIEVPQGTTVTFNPSRDAIATVDALCLFRARINACGSLALLQWASIDWQMKSFAGWGKFEIGISNEPDFLNGIYDLIYSTWTRMAEIVNALEKEHGEMIERLRGQDAPVTSPDLTYDAKCAILLAEFGYDGKSRVDVDFENQKCAMKELVHFLAIAIMERYNKNPYSFYLAESANEALQQTFEQLWKASSQLRDAAVAWHCAQFAERKEAA